MQNLKYLKGVIDEKNRFGVILNKLALKHTEHIQFRIVVGILEFFNSGKYVKEKNIKKIGNVFYVPKEKYISDWLNLHKEWRKSKIEVSSNDT